MPSIAVGGRNLRWAGTVALEGNEVDTFEPVNFWSPDNQPSLIARDRIAFRGVTAGNLQGLDLLCREPGVGRLQFSSNNGEAVVDIASLAERDLVAAFDGLDTRVTISAIDDAAAVRQCQLDRRFAVTESGDTRLYVRVTQTDGHQAWSTPIYLFRRPAGPISIAE